LANIRKTFKKNKERLITILTKPECQMRNLQFIFIPHLPNSIQGRRRLEPIPAEIGWEAVPLGRSPVYHRAMRNQNNEIQIQKLKL